MNNWYKEHQPAIFIFFVLALGLALIVISNYLSSEDSFSILKPILAGIGGTFTAGSIATLFLSLPRTREYISNAISVLFTTGEIVNSLSSEYSYFLKKKILSNEIGSSVEKIENSLYDKINDIQNDCQSDFHLHNCLVDFTIVNSKKYKKFVEEEQFISYRVVTKHLPPNHPRIFQLTVEYHSPIKDNTTLTKEEFIQNFKVKMGGDFFDENDLEVIKFSSDDEKKYKYKFSKEVHVTDTLDVEFRAKIIKPLIDQSYSLYTRYPTKGYSAKLSYRDDFNYESNWFRYWNKKEKIIDTILDKKEFTNGISVITRDWLLPGEGVVLEFY